MVSQSVILSALPPTFVLSTNCTAMEDEEKENGEEEDKDDDDEKEIELLIDDNEYGATVYHKKDDKTIAFK